jgi:acyl carrier protein
MTGSNFEAEIRALVAETSSCDVSRLDPDDDFCEALGLDSLDRLNVLAAVEKHFDVSFADEQISELRSVADVLGAVEALLLEYA